MANQYERIATPGVPITGDIEVNGVLIPFGNLERWSQGELNAHGLRRVLVLDPPRPVRPPTLAKRILIERLYAADKFAQAVALIGGPGSYTYERWSASNYVNPEHPDVIALLTAIGGDLDTLLAWPTTEEENS